MKRDEEEAPEEVLSEVVREQPPGVDGDPGSATGREIQEGSTSADGPGIDEFVDNTKALLARSTEVLPFVWVAVVLMATTPAMVRIALGQDPLAPLSFDMSMGMVLMELGFHMGAVALLALSMPVGRAYMRGDGEGPQSFGAAFSVMGESVDDAVLIAVVYFICVVVGLMMCVLPGVFAAVYLAPALYLAAARGESTFRALLKGSTQLAKYSNLYVFVIVALGAIFLTVAMGLGLTIQHIGGSDELASLAAEPMAMVAVAAAFLVVTGLLYLVYIAALGVFVTIEAFEER